jgi:hypothetical protein
MKRLLQFNDAAQQYKIPHLLLDPEERERELRRAIEEHLPSNPVSQDRTQHDLAIYSANSIILIEAKGSSSSLLQEASIRFLKRWKELEREQPHLTKSEAAEELLGGSYHRTLSTGGFYNIDVVSEIGHGATGSGKSSTFLALFKALYTFASVHQSGHSGELDHHGEVANLLVDWYYRDIFRERVRNWLRRNSSQLIHQATPSSQCRHIFQRMFNRRFRNSRRSRRLLRQYANRTFLMLSGDALERRLTPVGTPTQDQGTARHHTWQT